jgi:hypothetical protein
MDRSSSMADDINETSCPGGCGASSKWSIASAAVETMVAQNPQINWGLAFYGGDAQCDVEWAVNVGTDSGAAIVAALASTTPGGDAPTSAAIANAALNLKGLWCGDILLVSDGRSGCGASATDGTGRYDAEQAAYAALNQSYVLTLVLGLAPSWDTAAVRHLNTLALNGGYAPPVNGIAYNTPDNPPTFPAVLGPVCFVPAAPPASVPMDGSGIVVSLNLSTGGTVNVPKDPNNGWSVNSAATAVVISGDYCAQLSSGAATSVIVRSCPTY